ncbi:MAG: DUF4878 domain-containing protein [Bacteroidales bacterium]|nr:DUF4878 domain-containing protein [Bacteroidales bacterium]
MKKLVIFLSIALCALFTVSCKSGPEAVADKAMNALQKGDLETYFSTMDLDKESKSVVSLMGDKILEPIKEKGGIKSYTIGKAVIDGEKATVPVSIKYGDGSEENFDMAFIKKDKEWKQTGNSSFGSGLGSAFGDISESEADNFGSDNDYAFDDESESEDEDAFEDEDALEDEDAFEDEDIVEVQDTLEW